MNSRPNKTPIFLLEGSNSFAVTCYFAYIYFYTQKKFGFTNEANLALAAVSGLIYIPAALWAGKFAQRAGYFAALKTGFAIMITALLAGWLVATSAAAHIAVMLVTTVGMCFIWPTLEGFMGEGETYENLQHLIGIYNVVWASTNALAYFVGGAMLDKLGLNALFYIPVALMSVQLAFVFYLQRFAGLPLYHAAPAPADQEHPVHAPAKTKTFLRMAWLANPFAYIAINTLIAVMPDVANRLHLSTTQAGAYCFLWSFARLGAFFVLWFWDGWHYKFRWLIASYLALIVTFTIVLLARSLAVVVLAEVVFGGAIGLIYYSSLFYSLDVGDTKSEHGGIHEAAIGIGNFAGPAVGTVSLFLLPQSPNSGTVAVSVLLVVGLASLLVVRCRRR